MKVHHAYCGRQHRSSVLPVLKEMRARGHEIVEVSLTHDDIQKRKPEFDHVDTSNSDIFIASYPRIMRYKHPERGDISYEHGAKKTVCIEHGVNPIAWAFPLDRHSLFDFVFVAGKWQNDAAARSDFSSKLLKKCVKTGWAKSDFLHKKGNEKTRKEYRRKLEGKFSLDSTKPIVAWTPTHNAAWDKTGEIVDSIARDVNLVIAPHEGTYSKFKDGTLGMNYQADYPLYIETDNIYDVILSADIVISDYSSVALEATILGVPIIQILKNMRLHNRSGNPYEIGYYPLSQNDPREFKLGSNIRDINTELPKEIEKAISLGSDYWRSEREFWRDETFYDIGNATKNCCDMLEKIIA